MSGVFERLLAVVRRIPRGRVASYGQVATLAGLKHYARHVGYALHALPEGTPLPWHRVVNARGGISLRGFNGAAETLALRLAAEGVEFDPRGRVRLERFGWRPRGVQGVIVRSRTGRARGGRPGRFDSPSRLG